MKRAWILLLAACSQAASVEPIIGKVFEGRELIGTPPPSLAGISWTDGQAHPLTEDRPAAGMFGGRKSRGRAGR